MGQQRLLTAAWTVGFFGEAVVGEVPVGVAVAVPDGLGPVGEGSVGGGGVVVDQIEGADLPVLAGAGEEPVDQVTDGALGQVGAGGPQGVQGGEEAVVGGVPALGGGVGAVAPDLGQGGQESVVLEGEQGAVGGVPVGVGVFEQGQGVGEQDAVPPVVANQTVGTFLVVVEVAIGVDACGEGVDETVQDFGGSGQGLVEEGVEEVEAGPCGVPALTSPHSLLDVPYATG